MDALNIDAEFRKATNTNAKYPDVYAADMVRRGEWIEDDGDFYTREEWDSQSPSEGELVLDAMIAEEPTCDECGQIITDSQWAGSTDHGQACTLHPSNIMEQPEPEQPERYCTCGHPECGAC